MKKVNFINVKQKAFTLIICLFLSSIQLDAQTWFPLGSEWTYSTYIPTEGRTLVSSVYVVRDTTIQGNKAVILKGSSGCSACKTDNIFYYDSAQNIVYQYLDSNFKPYFDFSKQAGESYTMYFFSTFNQTIGYDSVLIRIDSIVTYPISGINVRVQFISILGNSHYSFSGPIIEFIGSKEGFYPEDGACDFSVFRGLRCYSDSVLTYYTDSIFQVKGCDYDVSISETNSLEMLKVYPNPVSYQLIVENEKSILKNARIYDLLGKEVKRFSINTTHTTLDIHDLQNGMYFMEVETENGKITKKFIKQ